MNTVIHRPKGLNIRRYPTAKRIAAAMLQDPDLLRLRTRRLQADARARFGCSESTARMAVAFARANNRGDSRGTGAMR